MRSSPSRGRRWSSGPAHAARRRCGGATEGRQRGRVDHERRRGIDGSAAFVAALETVHQARRRGSGRRPLRGARRRLPPSEQLHPHPYNRAHADHPRPRVPSGAAVPARRLRMGARRPGSTRRSSPRHRRGDRGLGEMSVISPVYADSFAAGARAGVAELAPAPARRRPDAAGRRRGAARRRDARAALRQVRDRHGLLGRERRRQRDGRSGTRRSARASATRVPLYNVVTVLAASTRPSRSPASSSPRATGGSRSRSARTPVVDAERLAAVRDAVGPDVVLYADANGAFTTGGRPTLPARDARPRVHPRAAVPHLRRVRVACAATATGHSCSTSRS